MNKLNIFAAMGLLLTVSLGCLGPGADESKCEGIVKSRGKEYVGKSKTEAQAGLNACNKFCLDDEEFEAMYEIWTKSEKAKRLEESRGKKISKDEAVLADKKLLDYVTQNCAIRCRDEANEGHHTLETTCRE